MSRPERNVVPPSDRHSGLVVRLGRAWLVTVPDYSTHRRVVAVTATEREIFVIDRWGFAGVANGSARSTPSFWYPDPTPERSGCSVPSSPRALTCGWTESEVWLAEEGVPLQDGMLPHHAMLERYRLARADHPPRVSTHYGTRIPVPDPPFCCNCSLSDRFGRGAPVSDGIELTIVPVVVPTRYGNHNFLIDVGLSLVRSTILSKRSDSALNAYVPCLSDPLAALVARSDWRQVTRRHDPRDHGDELRRGV
jgi:hypothetical protein